MTNVAVSTTKLPPAFVGIAYEGAIACSTIAGAAELSAGTTQTNKDALPSSLSYGNDGRITGTPVAGDEGVYNLSVKVTDSSGTDTAKDNVALTLHIYGAPQNSDERADESLADQLVQLDLA
jgi:Putative Ig domain